VAQAGFEAFRRDPRAAAEVLAEDVEVFSSPELANAGEFTGRQGYLRWIEPWVEVWQDLQMEITGITPVGERCVIVDVHQTAQGREGIEVTMDVTFLFEVRDDGTVGYMALHPDRKSAEADARVRERS
jgi:ketosteroid isomerase-like protein